MILKCARTLTLLATAAVGFAPGETAAQSAATDSPRIPAVMISVGAGSAGDMGDWRDGGPVQVLSAQFLLSRNLVVEGEATRWQTHISSVLPMFDGGSPCLPNETVPECGLRRPVLVGFRAVSETDDGWSGGANLLFRSEPHRRVSGFGGGGAFIGQRSLDSPRRGLALGGQALGGADVQVAGPLHAYGDLRFIAMSGQVRLAATGGVRVVAHTRPAMSDVPSQVRATVTPAEAAGKTVRVSLADNARHHGRFVSLSTSELVLRDGGEDIRYPLDQVRLVETAHNTAVKGALIGCGAGVLAMTPVARALDLPGDVALAMTCGIGTGAGALIGALMDIAAADKHVVYAPALTPTHAGGTLTVRW
jgi:hypothetical protein